MSSDPSWQSQACDSAGEESKYLQKASRARSLSTGTVVQTRYLGARTFMGCEGSVGFWPKWAVSVSRVGCEIEKVTDFDDRPLSPHS